MLCQHCTQDERHVAMVRYLLCYHISFTKILPRIFMSVFMRGLKWNFIFKKEFMRICVYDMWCSQKPERVTFFRDGIMVVVSCHMGARFKLRSSSRAASGLNHRAISLALGYFLFHVVLEFHVRVRSGLRVSWEVCLPAEKF